MAELLEELRSEVARLRSLVTGIGAALHREFGSEGILVMLAERIEALASELSWELGVPETSGPPVAPVAARFDHVGIVVEDLGRVGEFYGDVLGGRLVAGGSHAGLGARSAHYLFPGGGKIELLQPVGPGGIADFLERRGEGTHHFAYFVDDLRDYVDDLVARGFEVAGRSRDEDGWEEAYVIPRSAGGCLIQLVSSPEPLAEVDGITLREVLSDEWEWAAHRPTRRKGSRDV